MPTNVTDRDKIIESLVMAKAVVIFDPFRYTVWNHNLDDTGVFDFDGFYLDHHKSRVDVKALEGDKDKYRSNIMSVEKYEDYVANGHILDYYLVYYYPENRVCRIYDLHRCEFAVRDIQIFHKREKIYKDCTVAFISSADKFEFKDFYITNEEIKIESDRKNRQDQYTSEPKAQEDVFEQGYVEM